MNDQYEFWEHDNAVQDGVALARMTDPETSHDAAQALEGDEASRMERIVLEGIRCTQSTGATNHEIVELTGLCWNTTSPRIRPLVERGLVVDSGERRKDPLKSNRA